MKKQEYKTQMKKALNEYLDNAPLKNKEELLKTFKLNPKFKNEFSEHLEIISGLIISSFCNDSFASNEMYNRYYLKKGFSKLNQCILDMHEYYLSENQMIDIIEQLNSQYPDQFNKNNYNEKMQILKTNLNLTFPNANTFINTFKN